MGNTNARVFPEPVGAETQMSRTETRWAKCVVEIIWGRTRAWMGKRAVMLVVVSWDIRWGCKFRRAAESAMGRGVRWRAAEREGERGGGEEEESESESLEKSKSSSCSFVIFVGAFWGRRGGEVGEREKRTFELGFGESEPVSEPDSELLSESELERESDLVAAGEGQSFRFFDFFCGAADLGCGAVGSKRCTPNIYYLVLEREFQYWGSGQLELRKIVIFKL